MALALGSFTVTFFVVGLVTATVSLATKRKSVEPLAIREALLAHFILFSIGISFLCNFVFHALFGKLAASPSSAGQIEL